MDVRRYLMVAGSWFHFKVAVAFTTLSLLLIVALSLGRAFADETCQSPYMSKITSI